MVFRPLAGLALALLLAPAAGSRARSAPTLRPGPAVAARAHTLSRRPVSDDGECVHAIVRGRPDRPLGIVQA